MTRFIDGLHKAGDAPGHKIVFASWVCVFIVVVFVCGGGGDGGGYWYDIVCAAGLF